MDTNDLQKLLSQSAKTQPRGLFSIIDNGDNFQIQFQAVVANEVKQQIVKTPNIINTYAAAKDQIFDIVMVGDLLLVDNNVFVVQALAKGVN